MVVDIGNIRKGRFCEIDEIQQNLGDFNPHSSLHPITCIRFPRLQPNTNTSLSLLCDSIATLMPHQEIDHSHIASAPFEGPEKLLEIWFAPSAADVPDAHIQGKTGLRKVDRAIWEEMLDIVQCKVLSVIQGDEMDAYLLRSVHLRLLPVATD